VGVERRFGIGRDTVRIVRGSDAIAPSDARGENRLVEAQQLTETAPKILHSKGCFEAV